MIIAVDFDGTCVTNAYPDVGEDIGAVPVLKWLVEQGHKIILWTMRSGTPDLSDAVWWFESNDIPLFGINPNPEQDCWSSSPKAFAQIYIDDAALGCPLKVDMCISNGPFVDWVAVKQRLELAFKGSGLIGVRT